MTSMQYGYIRAHIEAAIRGVQAADDEQTSNPNAPYSSAGIVRKLEAAQTALQFAQNDTAH